MDLKKAVKVWQYFIIWFSIKYYIMVFYYGFPSCKEYDCLINDVALRDKTLLYRIVYGILMSLVHGVIESAVWFMMPYMKVYFIMSLYA
uniref:Uncharacterized protein n=1 Tax=viral metagenome TaxID=1070528 RepID=A0A6C0CQE2_9ZZZZ